MIGGEIFVLHSANKCDLLVETKILEYVTHKATWYFVFFFPMIVVEDFFGGFSTQKLAIERGGGINGKYSPFLKPAGNNYAENARD